MKPKVCFLRGSYLNPFEIQYIEPLMDQFDITLACPNYHRFDLSSIEMPLIKIPCVDYFNGRLPRTIFNRVVPNICKYLGYEEILIGLRKFLINYDIIHVPEESFYFTWQAANLKHQLGYKVITTQCEVNPFWYANRPSITKRAAHVRELTDLFLARSRRAKSALIMENVNPDKIKVVGHGVDIDKFKPGKKDNTLLKKYKISEGQVVILFVGRLVWTKGIIALADAAKLISKNKMIRDLNPVFLIVGDGPERQTLIERIKLLGVQEYFRLVGNQPYRLLSDIHRLADLFVLPSISTRDILEQFGIVLIESMACGKPVVTTHCGAIDEVVEDCGILVQPNDSYRLAEEMEKLILNKDKRQELGERGRNRVENNFTHEVISSMMADAYWQVLSK